MQLPVLTVTRDGPRSVFLLTILAGALLSGHVTRAETAAGPLVVVPQPVFDFGTLDQGTPVEHTFVVRNGGADTLRVDHVKSSCGCTVGVVAGRDVAPGEETFVAVRLDTTHLSGRTTKVVTVYTNDPAAPVFALTLTGQVQSDLVATPTPLYLGKVRHGEGARREITVVPGRPGGTYTVVDVQHSNPALRTTLVPLDGGGQRIDVELDRDVPLGRFSDQLTLRTTSPTQPALTIPVFGSVEGDVLVVPPQVTFGVIHAGTPPERDVRIRNRGTRPVAITRVVVPAHVVTYDLSTVEDGFEYRLTLRLQPGVPHGKLEGTVEIFTDHPGESRLVVPLFAIVRDGHKRG